MTPQIGIYNHATGETIVREMNAEELAEHEAKLEAVKQAEADKTKAETDKEAAQAKLAALGLTADDLKALGL